MYLKMEFFCYWVDFFCLRKNQNEILFRDFELLPIDLICRKLTSTIKRKIPALRAGIIYLYG